MVKDKRNRIIEHNHKSDPFPLNHVSHRNLHAFPQCGFLYKVFSIHQGKHLRGQRKYMQQIVLGMKSTRSVVWWKSLMAAQAVNQKLDDETCCFHVLSSCSIIAGNPFRIHKRANDITLGARKLGHVKTFLTDFTVDGGSSQAWWFLIVFNSLQSLSWMTKPELQLDCQEFLR